VARIEIALATTDKKLTDLAETVINIDAVKE
jgi:hypothetical protein